ncbi:hypothetical protein [Massilia antarctica]|nr:hypothetical protein [Massilia sp. H27-R4]MCY0916545.1 hypothetical protein [Massilia sp. H27-R4]
MSCKRRCDDRGGKPAINSSSTALARNKAKTRQRCVSDVLDTVLGQPGH